MPFKNKPKLLQKEFSKPCSYSRIRCSTSSTAAACRRIPSTLTPVYYFSIDQNETTQKRKQICPYLTNSGRDFLTFKRLDRLRKDIDMKALSQEPLKGKISRKKIGKREITGFFIDLYLFNSTKNKWETKDNLFFLQRDTKLLRNIELKETKITTKLHACFERHLES